MKPLIIAFLLASATLATATLAMAHGVPIQLTVADGSLTVSHDDNDYGPLIFGQRDEESDPIGPTFLPGIGNALLWGMPGIDITGMTDTTSLGLEPIARPFHGDVQTLWYWAPSTRRVVETPAGASLVLQLSDRDVVLNNDAVASPITLAETIAGETGFHNHSLVDYAMPYSSSLPLGLYGFFARFTSNAYAPSEQFLVTFNVGVAYEDLAPASEAIWLAANPGDYTLDGIVDAADYDVWAANYGGVPAMAQTAADGNGDGVVNAADYTLWRDNLSVAAASVPEPGAAVVALMLATALVQEGRRTGSVSARS